MHRSQWAAASTRLPGPRAKLPQDPFGGVNARSENQGCDNDEIKGAGVDHLSRNHVRAVREVDRAVPLGPARTDVVYGGDSANIRHRPKDRPIRYGGNSPHDRGFPRSRQSVAANPDRHDRSLITFAISRLILGGWQRKTAP
jgi:hypothetical protein